MRITNEGSTDRRGSSQKFGHSLLQFCECCWINVRHVFTLTWVVNDVEETGSRQWVAISDRVIRFIACNKQFFTQVGDFGGSQFLRGVSQRFSNRRSEDIRCVSV